MEDIQIGDYVRTTSNKPKMQRTGVDRMTEKECYMAQQDDIYSNWYMCSNCKEDFFWRRRAR